MFGSVHVQSIPGLHPNQNPRYSKTISLYAQDKIIPIPQKYEYKENIGDRIVYRNKDTYGPLQEKQRSLPPTMLYSGPLTQNPLLVPSMLFPELQPLIEDIRTAPQNHSVGTDEIIDSLPNMMAESVDSHEDIRDTALSTFQSQCGVFKQIVQQEEIKNDKLIRGKEIAVTVFKTLTSSLMEQVISVGKIIPFTLKRIQDTASGVYERLVSVDTNIAQIKNVDVQETTENVPPQMREVGVDAPVKPRFSVRPKFNPIKLNRTIYSMDNDETSKIKKDIPSTIKEHKSTSTNEIPYKLKRTRYTNTDVIQEAPEITDDILNKNKRFQELQAKNSLNEKLLAEQEKEREFLTSKLRQLEQKHSYLSGMKAATDNQFNKLVLVAKDLHEHKLITQSENYRLQEENYENKNQINKMWDEGTRLFNENNAMRSEGLQVVEENILLKQKLAEQNNPNDSSSGSPMSIDEEMNNQLHQLFPDDPLPAQLTELQTNIVTYQGFQSLLPSILNEPVLDPEQVQQTTNATVEMINELQVIQTNGLAPSNTRNVNNEVEVDYQDDVAPTRTRPRRNIRNTPRMRKYNMEDDTPPTSSRPKRNVRKVNYKEVSSEDSTGNRSSGSEYIP